MENAFALLLYLCPLFLGFISYFPFKFLKAISNGFGFEPLNGLVD